MGLADRYKENLRAQGIDVKLTLYKQKKNETSLIIFIISLMITVPTYTYLYLGYSSCAINEGAILPGPGINSLLFKCATDFGLYGAVAALLIAIIILLFIKALRQMSRKQKYN